MAVIDVVTFNGEHDLFEIRYNILKDYVDEFIVVEFDKTFSGNDKPCYAEQSKDYFYDSMLTWPKVKYFNFSHHHYMQYEEMAKASPNTVGASHWIREFCQKESIKDCLTHLKDEDMVFIGDCDEIWNPLVCDIEFGDIVFKLKLKVYSYYLNNRSSEDFWGTITCSYYLIKLNCLNHLRSRDHLKEDGQDSGWHFTSMGGVEALKKKLTDSYTDESYATSTVLNNVDHVYGTKDFLGRDFKYKVDESEWPELLKTHRHKYIHLLK